MRKDCNVALFRDITVQYFDSCMREDCNKLTHLLRRMYCDFDSCMREDCNICCGMCQRADYTF